MISSKQLDKYRIFQYHSILVKSPADDEENDADADVREDDTDPDLLGQRVQEAEDAGLLLDRLLDHDADAEGHEGFAEVDHSFALRGDGHRCDRQVRFLRQRHKYFEAQFTDVQFHTVIHAVIHTVSYSQRLMREKYAFNILFQT